MRSRGLTLAEVLIAGSIMLLITGLLTAIFSGSYSVFRRGTTRMSVTQRAREVVRRLTPVIMSSVAPDPLTEAVYLPATGQSGPVLELNTANDILVPHVPTDPRAPVHYSYRVWLEADGTVFIQPLDFTTKGLIGAPEVLAHRVQALEFEHLSLSTVKVTVTVRDQIVNASGQTEDLDVARSRIIGVPYYSSAR